jgi:succinoglycan biosynthesis protein ExoM
MTKSGDQRPVYSVCVATYRRPDMRRNLLQSLLGQELDEAADYEIVVVDNDAELSAETVVREYCKSHPGVVRYFTQPQKNIAITRNVAVAEARGRFLFFIDDDEIAAPRWMQRLIDCQRTFEADAVFGRIIPHFPEESPDWVRSTFFFNRHCQATGTPSRRRCSGNCMVRADLLAALDGPFDLRYGLTGGEDSQMFARLSARGAPRFVDCYEASHRVPDIGAHDLGMAA